MSAQNYQDSSHDLEDIAGDFVINPAGLDEVLGDSSYDPALESARDEFGRKSTEYNARNNIQESLNTQEALKQDSRGTKKLYLKNRSSYKEDPQTEVQYQVNPASLLRTQPSNEDTTQDRVNSYSKKNDSRANNSGFDSDSKPLNTRPKDIQEGSEVGDDYSSIHVSSRFKPEEQNKYSLKNVKHGNQGYEKQLSEKSALSYSIKDIESHVTDKELIETIEKAGLPRDPIFKSIEITPRSEHSLIQLKAREMPAFAIPTTRKTNLPPLRVNEVKYNQKKIGGLVSLKPEGNSEIVANQRNDIAIPFKNFSQTQKDEPLQEFIIPNFTKQTAEVQSKKKKKKKKKKSKKTAKIIAAEDQEVEDEGVKRKKSKVVPQQEKGKKKESKSTATTSKKRSNGTIEAKEKKGSSPVIDLEAGDKSKPPNKSEQSLQSPESSKKVEVVDTNRLIPRGCKVFYAFVLMFFVANFVLSLLQIILFGITGCPDDHLKIFVYVNFIILFFAKIGIFNFVTFEISGNLPLDLKYPFIIPCLAFGIFPIMQFPQFLYDWQTCKNHSVLFELNFAFTMTNILSIGSIFVFGGFLCLTFMFSGCKVPTKGLKFIRNSLYFIGFCFLMFLNGITLIMQFTQMSSFVPGFFLEIFGFWFFLVAGFVVYLLRRCRKMEVFRTIQELEEEERERDPQHQPKVKKGELLSIVKKDDFKSEEAQQINQEKAGDIEMATTNKGNLTFGHNKSINLEGN